MSKIEQLAAAFAASTPGEWEACGYNDLGRYIETLESGEICALKRGKFKQITDDEYLANTAVITLSHNLMPLLLEAVEVLAMTRKVRHGEGTTEYADMVDAKTLEILEKLK